MKFTSKQIDFMRQDIESGFMLSAMIEKTKERMKAEGRNFDKEYEQWKKENHIKD